MSHKYLFVKLLKQKLFLKKSEKLVKNSNLNERLNFLVVFLQIFIFFGKKIE